ncbi:hypothetical protein F5Y16DRAFT_393795 [Xylariaceae sp. FL0255]|nr:hypothetical protein F5Y16DRAFT_393795 [Xylariaceae sp. FL0255]
MTVHTEPKALLSHLQKADGSATYSYAGYTVIGAVNGPIEAQKRDELPEEAIVDVVVRPASGVGGTRERHLESLIQSTLRQIILINNFPRALIQIVLQISVAPENEYINAKLAQASVNLPILPTLLQTAILSLLSAALPLTATFTSVPLAIVSTGAGSEIVSYPTARQIEKSQSFHVFAFTSANELILAESEGGFTMKEWEDLYTVAQAQCCTESTSADADTTMDDGESTAADLKRFTRATVEETAIADLYWK